MDDLLRVREAAKRCGLSKSTFDKFRMRGAGPPYVKLGARVFYEPAALAKWIEANRHTCTAETRAAGGRQ